MTGHRGVSRHSSFLVTSPPKMVAFSGAGSGSVVAGLGLVENRGQLMAEMMMQQYETPIHRRSSMAEAAGGHGGHRSLAFHLSMPDIAANEKQQQPLQKLASSCSGGPRGSAKHRGYRQARPAEAAAAEGQTQHPCPQWTHNKKAQHRHENRGGHLATSSSSSSQKGRETKARQNLNAKLEAVRKLSSESSRSSGGSALSACDSGLGTPISLMGDEVSSMTTSSQNSSHLSKWRSSMSGKKTTTMLPTVASYVAHC